MHGLSGIFVCISLSLSLHRFLHSPECERVCVYVTKLRLSLSVSLRLSRLQFASFRDPALTISDVKQKVRFPHADMFSEQCDSTFAWFTLNLCNSNRFRIHSISQWQNAASNATSFPTSIAKFWARKIHFSFDWSYQMDGKTHAHTHTYMHTNPTQLNKSIKWVDMRVNEILCLVLNSFCHQLNGSPRIYDKFKSSANAVAMAVLAVVAVVCRQRHWNRQT